MNRNRQLSNVYWRNAKPYLNLQSTQPSINSTNKWVSFKSNTGNFIFNGSLAGCSVQLQFEFLWGDELSPSSYSHATSKSPIEAIASLKQVSVKRRLRTADSRLRTRGKMKTECKVCSPHCILHPACVLLSVCSQHFTLSLHFTPGPHSAFYTDRLSNSPRKQLDTHGPSVLNIYMGKPEIPVEKNKMVRVNPFEKLPKKGAVIWGDAIFLLLLVCSAYLDIHCSGSFFPPRQIL